MMKYFDLKVGFTCNNDCVHCVITDKKATKDYTTQEIKDIIDTVPKGTAIGFTGGEPTIRKDFIELLKYSRDTGHFATLQTNGTMFENIEFTNEAAKYLDSVLIAIHSSSAEVHDKIVGSNGKGMHARTIKGFLNLLNSSYNIDISTQTVISKLNMETLLDTYDWIQSVAPGIPMSITYPHPNGNAWRNREQVCPSYSELKPHLHKALAKWARFLRTEAIPLCYLTPYHEDLLFNFDTEVLKNLEFGKGGGIDPANATKSNILFDDKGRIDDYREANLTQRRKGPKCKECKFNDDCPGVWREYVIIHGKHFDLFPVKDKEETKKSIKQNREPIQGALIMSSNVKCSNTCLFCPGGAKPETDEQIEKEAFLHADYFIENKYDMIEISGADPGEMIDILPRLIDYLVKGGIKKVVLSTHGRTLANKDFVAKLKKAGLSSARIPLYGSEPIIHNKTVQAHQNSTDIAPFSEALRGIINCLDVGIAIRAHTLINQFNKDDLENILLLYTAAALKYNTSIEEYVISIAGISNIDYKFTGNWFIPTKDLTPYIEKLLKSEVMKKIYVKFLEIPYCVIGRDDERFENGRPDKVSMSPDLGNQICESGMGSDEDKSIPHYRVKSHFHECDNCDLLYKCSGMSENDLKMFGTYGLKAIKNIDNV